VSIEPAALAEVDPVAAPAGELLYALEDRPPLRETLFVALQHVFAVFVGMITPPLLIAGALKLDAADTAYLVSMSLFVSGIATILQTSRLGPIGSGLLSVQGTSFTFIAPIISTAGAAVASGASPKAALGGIFGLCMAGSLVVMLASRVIQRASAVITPVVTGTVVTLIGLTLIQVGMVGVGGGYGAMADGSFGSPQNLGLAGLVTAVILAFNGSRWPRLRMMSVVLGLCAGYLAALLLGRLDLGGMRQAPLLNLPVPLRFGLSFDASAFLPFLFMYLITVMESIGDLTATSTLSGQPIAGPRYFRRLQGGLLADGLNSFIGSVLNSFPSTTFAQNNGVIQLTGVGSRYVGMYVGAILVFLGLIPAVGVLVQALPAAALGGATLILFGMVATSGIRILGRVEMNRRNAIILATSLGLGLGVTFVPQVIHALPAMLRNALSSGIASGGMCALLLNLVLPGDRR
jgi:xanthine permease XanP